LIWFTVELDDKPGALARLANALAERSINISAIVGVAEDTDGALMLATSNAEGTRAAFESLKLAFEEHDPEGNLNLGDDPRVSQGLTDRGMGLGN
jgi:hypothetical protein